MFVVIAGLIGAGKTTLAKNMSQHLGWDFIGEPVETNPYLSDYYGDKSRWSYEMQMYLLGERFKLHQQAVWRRFDGVVQDRSIYEDTVFAEVQHNMGYMDTRAYENYLKMFEMMKTFLVYPDRILYLDVSVDTCMERIAQRDRTCESTIPREYMEELKLAYEGFLTEISQWSEVQRIDWEEYLKANAVVDEIYSIAEVPGKFKRSATLI
jgi:deoxyadenosine/deoxycytidine kinase